jgi:serine/threonine protein kinase
VLLYKLIWSHTPFESEYHSKTIENIKKGNIYFPPVISKDYYPKIKGFISRILIKNDADRPTASKCLNDVWLRSEFLKLDDFFKEIPV